MPTGTTSSRSSHSQLGLTLTELLIVIAIIGFLLLLLMLSLTTQIARSRDARRKADLERIKIAFEDYYNDNQCYPPPEVLEDCGGSSFRPYLSIVPCDPLTKEPYLYVPLEDSLQCKGYRVYGQLEDNTDPVINELGCGGTDGCGFSSDYNYGIAAGSSLYDSSIVVPTSESSPSPSSVATSPSPSSSYTGPMHACDPQGVCNVYANPGANGCPVWFIDAGCENSCSNPANWCES